MTTELKVGDLVVHSNYDRSLRVKSVAKGVAVCERIEEPKELNIRGEERYPIFVCQVGLLKPATVQGTQLSLI